MKLPQFLTRLVSSKLGRLEDARAQHTGWVRPLIALGGMTCTLLCAFMKQVAGFPNSVGTRITVLALLRVQS